MTENRQGGSIINKSESKYYNTALLMNQALIELLNKKDFEFITIKEICEKAGVNRSTFYLHYETIGDLLDECLENTNKKFVAYFNKDYKSFIEKKVQLKSHFSLYFYFLSLLCIILFFPTLALPQFKITFICFLYCWVD